MRDHERQQRMKRVFTAAVIHTDRVRQEGYQHHAGLEDKQKERQRLLFSPLCTSISVLQNSLIICVT